MPARSIGSRCNGACFCAARSYNRGEPQGALTPHGSRIASAVWLLGYGSLSLRIGSRSAIAVKNPSKLEANSRIAAIKAKTVMASTSLRAVPRSGASGGKGCGAAPPLRFVPLSIATAYHAQMARIQRGSSSISRAFNADSIFLAGVSNTVRAYAWRGSCVDLAPARKKRPPETLQTFDRRPTRF